MEKTGRPRRRLRKALALLLLLLVVLVIAAPWILSGAAGRGYLLRRVNASLKGTLHATDLDLSWTGGQALGGVELRDPAGQRVVKFDHLHTDAGLLSLLTGSENLGRVVLTGLELDLVRDQEGRLNLSEALGKKEEEEPEERTFDEVLRDLEQALPPSLRVDLEARDARVRYRDPALPEPVEWTGLAHLTLTDDVRLDCLGELAPGGLVTVEARLEGLAAARSGARLHVRARCSSGTTRLEQVVGALEADLRLATSPSAVAFEIAVDAERLQLSGAGRATLFDEQRHVTLTRPLEISWKPDSDLFATGADVELPAEIPFHLQVDSLDVPLDGNGLRGHALLTVDDSAGRVRWADRLREVAWRGWRAEVSLADHVTVDVKGRLASQGREGSLSLQGTARDLPDWKRARVDGVARLDDFPLEPVEELLGRESRLVDLLGERLDLDVRVASTGAGQHSVGLRAASTHLVVEGPLEVDAGADRVATRGLTARWSLSPAVARRLFRGGRLDEAVPVRLQVESLETRLTHLAPSETALTGSLSIGDGSLLLEQEEIAWRGLMASVTAPNVREGLQLHATGEITQGDERTTIDVHGNLANLWNEAGVFEPARFRGELTARLQGLPAGALALPADVLDGRCDAVLEATGGAEASHAHLTLTAKNLDARIPLSLGEQVVVEDATVRYRPPPRLAEGDLVVTVPRLRIPVPWNVADLRGEARLRADNLVVSGVTLRDLNGRFDAETFALTGQVTGLADARLERGLAPPVDVSLEGSVDLARLPTVDRIGVQLKGAVLRAAGVVRLEDGKRLVVTERAAVDFELRPGVLDEVDLDAPVQLHVEVPRLELSGIAGHVEASGIAGRVEVPWIAERVGLSGIAGHAEVSAPQVALRGATLSDVRLTADAAGELTVEGGGRITRPGRPRPFSVAARFTDERSWEAQVENLSIYLVEAFAGGKGLVEAFGEEATVDVGRGADTAHCHIRTPRLELYAEGPWGESIALSKQATVRWTVTPAAWPAGGSFALRAPAVVVARIDRFRLPLRREGPAWKPAWKELALKADVEVAQLDLRDVEGDQPLTVTDIQLAATAAEDQLHVTGDGRLNGNGRVHAEAQLAEPARLAGHSSWGALLALPKPRGALREAVTGHGDVRLVGIPAWLLDRLFVLDEYARAVLGPTASATASWSVKGGNGPLHVKIDAPRAQADVDARLTPAGVCLDKDLTADLTLTPELGALVLPKLGPFFRGLVSAEHPVRVRIQPEGFLVPLERFDIENVKVSNASFDVGRAVLDNAWLTDVLQAVTKQRAPGGQTSAWFTPLDLELTNGVIRYRKRVDLLTQEKMHLASWGEVDLGKDRLDLTFAFMPDALRHHLGVSRAKDGDALRIPVRGTIEKPKVILGNALGDLAKIQLREKAVARIKDPFGRAIAEAVLENLFAKSLRGGAVPPATVDPLPWTPQEEEPGKGD